MSDNLVRLLMSAVLFAGTGVISWLGARRNGAGGGSRRRLRVVGEGDDPGRAPSSRRRRAELHLVR